MAAITDLSLTDLRAGLDSRELSSEEITNSYLDQIEKYKNLNAFISVFADEARASALSADARITKGEKGPLLGIPVAIKDNIVLKGSLTTCGSKMLENFIPPYESTVGAKLKSAGSVFLGKTNMDEFGMGSSTENSNFKPTKNPWNAERVPGGSSGGSATAVSAGLAPIALGSDTGGSVRQPSSFCGVFGLKPTYGRVSRYGLVAFASSLDQIGIIAQNSLDAAVMAEGIFGHDAMDSTSVDREVPELTASIEEGVEGLRIGIPKEYFSEGIDQEVDAAVKAAAAELEKLGAKIVEVSLPHTSAAVPTYYILAPAEASSNLSRYDGIRYGHRTESPGNLQDLYMKTRSEGFGSEVTRRVLIGTYVLSSGYYDAYYLRAQKVRRLIQEDFQKVFAKSCDVLITPTAPTTAFKLGEKVDDPLKMYANDICTIPLSLAGLPAVSLPCGFDKQGLPIGMQIIGNAWEEARLLQVSKAYEKVSSWNEKTPTLENGQS